MELGVLTFAELAQDPATGRALSPGERLRNVVEEIELADRVGLDIYGVGEHHRPDFAVSSPAVVLAAAAARTQRIRLTSAVSVLSATDPVRVYQDFATLDLLSGGRAEIMAGRGAFLEAYPLFGHDVRDYDALFTEKLELLLRIRESERVTWSGFHRAPLVGRGVYPRAQQSPLPVWVAVAGTPESVVRAGSLGLPVALSIISGMHDRFAHFVDLHRGAAERAGHAPPPFGICSPGWVAETAERAIEESWPPVSAWSDHVARERGGPSMSREEYEASVTLRGASVVGGPKEVIEKILFEHEIFGHDRFMLHLMGGWLPHETTLRAIEIFGTEVAPAVRAEVARRKANAPAGSPRRAVQGS